MTLRAVIFDLDDTLVPQGPWLEGAWNAVAIAGGAQGADPVALRAALLDESAAGSARGGIIDRAAARVSPALSVGPLLEAFWTYRPPALDPYPGAADAVASVRAVVPVGLISDGRPEIQRSKLAASGLAGAFDVVVLSDELGREHRKPDPLPFRTALGELGTAPGETAFVGDRPETDIAGASGAGLFTVRVRTGEYASLPAPVTPDLDVATVRDAVAALLPLLAAGDRAPGGTISP